jgi:hypothetical protein
MDEWRALTRIAARHDGVVSAEHLRSVGFVTAHDRHRLVASGRLVKVTASVWRIEGAPTTWEQQLRIGLLTLGPSACISHDAAGQRHTFDRTPRNRVEFTVPRSKRTQRPPFTVHTTRSLPKIDVVRIGGLRYTSATRTVIDLARARVDTDRLAAAIDSSVRTGASAPAVLQRRLADLRGPGRWGCRRIDELLAHAGGHSMLERYFLQLMDEGELPRPRTQVVFRQGDRTLARVDFLFEPYPIVVEVSGRLGHTTPADRARDAQRRNELQDLGFAVYEYTYAQVTQQPAWVIETMESRLRAVGWTGDRWIG